MLQFIWLITSNPLTNVGENNGGLDVGSNEVYEKSWTTFLCLGMLVEPILCQKENYFIFRSYSQK